MSRFQFVHGVDAETFAQAYSGTHWIDKERARLTAAIEEAERAENK